MSKERTFIILKPDAIQRGLVGEIVKRIEVKGFKIVGMKMLESKETQIFEHYNKDDVWFEKKGTATVENMQKLGMEVTKPAIEYGRDIIRALAIYMRANPVIAIAVEGDNVVGVVRKMVGDTQPLTADVGTIRGDFSNDSYEHANIGARAVRNVIHCSENVEDANRELAIWFNQNELFNYTLATEKLAYDINLDGKVD